MAFAEGPANAMWTWFIGNAAAALWTVGPTQPLTTVQSAILAASSGDTIQVLPGRYEEALNLFGKDLVIQSSGGPTITTLAPPTGQTAVRYLDGESGRLEGFTLELDEGRAIDVLNGGPELRSLVIETAGQTGAQGGAIRIRGGTTRIEDVTIEDAFGGEGGALWVGENAEVTLATVYITNAQASRGGAVYANDAVIEATDLIIDTPWADQGGAGIYASAASVTITTLSIVDPRGDRAVGVGVHLRDGSRLEVDGGRIEGAATLTPARGYDGGGVYLDGASGVVLSGFTLADNAAGRGGGIATDGGDVQLTGVTFEGNTAATEGGGVAAVSSAIVEVVASRFVDNDATSGGALHLRTLARLTDIGSIYVSNEASEAGGAVFADGATAVDLTDITFQANRSDGNGGAIAVDDVASGLLVQDARFDSNRAGESGGAIVVGDATPVELANLTFVSNQCQSGHGGAVLVSPSLASGAADVTVTSTRFDGNHAVGDGGGLALVAIDELDVVESTFLFNSARGRGGGLLVDGARQVELSRSTWHENTAERGGGVYEAASLQPSDIRSCTFTENVAESGAGLTLRGTAAAEIVNNTFVGNRASTVGAHLHVSQGSMRLINTIAAWAADGGGIYGDTTAATFSDRFYHLTWENAGGTWVGQFTSPVPSSQAIQADPQFVAYTQDGNLADDDLRLATGSPAVDAGDPGLFDVDGSRSDLGAWGGPSGFVVDLDGDGSYAHVDCDDEDPRRSPDQVELPYDGLDQDCDGIDLADVDTDGFDGGPNGTDCDDTDPAVYPGAVDPPYDGVDGDCASDSDFDVDRDGHDSDDWGGTDCDDTDPGVRPGGVEVYYDGIDGNCDGRSDYDQDGDGRDALAHGGDDCNDIAAAVFPGAPETCDRIDNDCNGLDDDEPTNPRTFYVDADGDGFGDANRWELHCFVQTGLAERAGDCDDSEAAVNPDAAERWYDGVDDDCDGRDDDQDGDGYLYAEDCNDVDATVHPGAAEAENGIDDDCDGFAETADRDADGLIDWVEWQLRTDPQVADSDEDGVPDGAEAPGGSSVDTDQDGGIDALDPDDDGDGIDTFLEVTVDVDADGDADRDIDRDGTPNHLDLDTDGDGRPDLEEGTEDRDGDGVPDFADPQGGLAGAGCATAPVGSLWLVGLVVMGLRRRAGWFLGSISSSAYAQGLDAHTFEIYDPTNDARSGLRVSEGGRLRRGITATALIDAAGESLVETLPDGNVGLVDGLLTAHAVVSGAPWSRVRVDAAMPVHLYGQGAAGAFAAPGDLRLGVSGVVLPQAGQGLGVSAMVHGWVPTGSARRYVGLPGPAVAPVAAVAQRLGRFGWAVNVGARIAQGVDVRNATVGAGPIAGAGAHYVVSSQWVVRAEALTDSTTGFAAWPVELAVGTAWQRPNGQTWSADVSVGFGQAPGVPSWRVAMGVAVGPTPELPVIAVHAPLPPEPEPDPVPLPDMIEVRIVREDPPPPEPAEPVIAAVERDRIVVSEQVFFFEGSADLRDRSIPVLRAVLGVLRQHPDIDYLLVEGHTNHHGTAAYNRWLSQARADSVGQWLMGQGVPRERLLMEGYGFDQPLIAKNAPDAATVNRRVEFVLVRSEERDAPPPSIPSEPREGSDDLVADTAFEDALDEPGLPEPAYPETPEPVDDEVPARPTARDSRFPSPVESWVPSVRDMPAP